MEYAVLADILGAEIDRPEILETTALGAAWLAGMKAGFYPKKKILQNLGSLKKDLNHKSKKKKEKSYMMAGKMLLLELLQEKAK